MKDQEPTVSQQIVDRKGQREKLAAFLKANPFTIFSQETLAEASGSDIGAIRTRLSELKTGKFGLRLELRTHPQSYRDAAGVWHRGKLMWECVERPAQPLGRDAGDRVALTLFDMRPSR